MRTRVLAWMAGLFLVAGGVWGVAADPPNLDAEIAAAKGGFQPLAADRLAKAQQRLAAAADQLERFISRAGPDVTKRWKDYLRLDDLRAQLAAEKADPKVVAAALEKFESGVVGMEVPAFRDTRHALQDYQAVLQLARDEKLGDRYAEELDALSKSVAAYKDKASVDEAHRIGRIAAWLDRLGHAEKLATAIRGTYRYPNLHARISGKLISSGMNDVVEDHSYVRDNILGTSIYANAHTTGQVTSVLTPDPNHASFQVHMVGTTYASSTGYNGPATIRSSSVTNLEGWKQVMFDASGVHALNATATAATGSTIHSIAAGCRLIEKVAWKRAGQQKGSTERVASQHAAGRLAGRLNSQSATMLADIETRYNEKFRLPLLRRDAFPAILAFATTADDIRVTGLQATPGQIAAPTEPPPVEGSHDLSVQAHQSAINNIAESMLGHQTLTDVRLAKLVEDMTGEVPEELQIKEDKDPWSITFAGDQPVTVEVEDQGVTIAIRGSRFTRGETRVSKAMMIFASYKVEKTAEGSKLVRQGDVTAEYLNKDRPSVPEIALRTTMKNKFSALFKPEIESKGLKLKGRFEKIGILKLKQLLADNGWLVLAWDPEAPVGAE